MKPPQEGTVHACSQKPTELASATVVRNPEGWTLVLWGAAMVQVFHCPWCGYLLESRRSTP